MKIDLNQIDRNSFYVNEHIWNGQVVYLVIPREMGCEWNKDNVIFRSSVWDSEGNPVSLSFKKFVNWNEKPDVFPIPSSLKNATIVEKLDGSTLIVSKYKGNYMIRTRGTIDASKMEKNGHEIEVFKNEVLPKVFKSYLISPNADTWNYSFIFEWASDLNKIVLSYGDKPQFFLIGVIWHGDYRMLTQMELDNFGWELGLQRPETYKFNTIEEMLASAKALIGKEGYCVYHSDDQHITKSKGDWYLLRHYLKSQLNTTEKVVEFWLEEGMPDYVEFQAKVEALDYELWNQVRDYASKTLDAYKQVIGIIDGFKVFVDKHKHLSRKDFAGINIQTNGGNSSFVFQLLDGKDLYSNKDVVKKLLFQVLK